MKRFMKKVLKFFKRVLQLALLLPLTLLVIPLLVLVASFFFLFDIPIPKTKDEKEKECYFNKAKENATELSKSLCSLEQNNYIDADYLMPIIKSQLFKIQTSLIFLS